MKILKNIKDVILRPADGFLRISEEGGIKASFFLYLLISLPTCFLDTEVRFSIFKIFLVFVVVLEFFVLPLVIHIISRRYTDCGDLRSLLALWGYTAVPTIFSTILTIGLLYYEPPVIFFLISAVFMCALLVWSLILLIMAIRVVYKFTLKRVCLVLILFLLMGTILDSIFVSFNETFLFQQDTERVHREAMNLTIKEDDLFIKDKISYLIKRPNKGDLIVFVGEEDIKKFAFIIALSSLGSTPIWTYEIGGCPEHLGRIEEIRDDGFVVVPDDPIFFEPPYGLIKKSQIKGRVCEIIHISDYISKFIGENGDES